MFLDSCGSLRQLFSYVGVWYVLSYWLIKLSSAGFESSFIGPSKKKTDVCKQKPPAYFRNEYCHWELENLIG